MVVPLALALCLVSQQHGPLGIEFSGSRILTAPREARVVRIVNRSHRPVDAGLVLWLPPGLRLTGLPRSLSLAGGAAVSLGCHLQAEADLPASVLPIKVVLEFAGSDDSPAELELSLRVALGRDLLRHGFEPSPRDVGRRGRRQAGYRVAGDGSAEVVKGDAPVGAGYLQVRPAEDADSPVTCELWRPEWGSFFTADFPSLTLHLRASAGAAATLVVEADGRSSISPLCGGGSDRPADGNWRRVVLPLTGDELSSVAVVVSGQGRLDIDDFALVRSSSIQPGDRLRDLCERYADASPTAAVGIDAMQRSLAALAGTELSGQARVDQELLRHALEWQRLQLTLPATRPGQPVGKAWFEGRLRHLHHLQLSSDELLELGLRQVAEHQAALDRIAPEIAPGSSWRQVANLLESRHPSAADLPGFAAAAMQAAIDFTVREGLVTVPMAARDARIKVVTSGRLSRTYPFGGYGGARRSPTGFVGTYFVSPPADWMNAEQAAARLRGNHAAWTRVVALHEIVPGHHLQTVVHRMRPLSRFRRKFYSTVFAEGWALYCEELLYRAGFFPDPATRFTQLQMRLWRAARIVIDVSLHTERMSQAEAVVYLQHAVGLSATNAGSEVLRYISNPTRPMSYLVGYLELVDLIDVARRRFGREFELSRFLDRFLAFGPVPIAAVRRGLGL